MGSILFVLTPVLYIGLPIVLVTGWLREVRSTPKEGTLALFVRIAFMLGTVSVLFAIGGVIYAVARGGFRYYDPVLVRIYQMGSLVSLFAAVFAILGIWRSSPLRWHALILSLGMLFLWLVWAAAE